ncbi:uncharacterized protein isoform X2 [Rhodnius prolixus]|uniref:uncharacterized protein isoform X2 n=1 Tax=Rhodnius prolixus TaxID=13249 RepID=UPI003D18B30A
MPIKSFCDVLFFIFNLCVHVLMLTGVIMLMFFMQDLAHGFAHLQPLSCNSINQIPESASIAFIYITPSERDCTFLFEGPAHLSLNMKLRSLSQKSQLSRDKCSNSTLRMYYLKNNRVELDKIVCSEAAVITDSNMGIVTSSLNDGAFVLEVRPLSKSSPFNSEIFGMIPPINGARDYYGSSRFIPSPSLQSGWSPFRAFPTPSFYPISNYLRPEAPYPGKPTNFVDLTYNQTGPTNAAISSLANVTAMAISGISANSSQETLNSSTEHPTTHGSTTYVEIHISNSTDVMHKKN